MGLIKKIGKGLKKVGKGLGKAWEKVDDIALPAVGFALGGPAGAALGAAAARGIGDGKFNAKATLMAGAKGFAGGQLASTAGLVGGQGFGALGSSAKQAITNPMATGRSVLGMGGGAKSIDLPPVPSGAPDLNAGADAWGKFARGGGGGGAATGAIGSGGFGDRLKRIGRVAMNNIDPILGAASMYEGYRADKRGQKLQDRALALQEQEYAMRAPLRQKSLGMLMEDEPARLPRYRTQNPFG